MEVHAVLGQGFLESVYQEALALEFSSRGIPFEKEALLRVEYKGNCLSSPFRADFLCYKSVIVETKTVESINDAHYAQVIHYLKATGFTTALLINFKSKSLDYRRVVLERECR